MLFHRPGSIERERVNDRLIERPRACSAQFGDRVTFGSVETMNRHRRYALDGTANLNDRFDAISRGAGARQKRSPWGRTSHLAGDARAASCMTPQAGIHAARHVQV